MNPRSMTRMVLLRRRAWAEAMKSVPMKTYQYIEVPGGDHGSVIGSHQAEIFAFFAKHSR